MNQQQQVRPEPIAERQFCGYILALIGMIFLIIGTIGSVLRAFEETELIEQVYGGLEALSSLFGATFFYLIISRPDYLKGKPGISKMWALILSSLVRLTAFSIVNIAYKLYYKIGLFVIIELLILGVNYAMYFGDDDRGSCCLCFKPFIHKRPVVIYVPSYGYPPQAYPPAQPAQVQKPAV